MNLDGFPVNFPRSFLDTRSLSSPGGTSFAFCGSFHKPKNLSKLASMTSGALIFLFVLSSPTSGVEFSRLISCSAIIGGVSSVGALVAFIRSFHRSKSSCVWVWPFLSGSGSSIHSGSCSTLPPLLHSRSAPRVPARSLSRQSRVRVLSVLASTSSPSWRSLSLYQDGSSLSLKGPFRRPVISASPSRSPSRRWCSEPLVCIILPSRPVSLSLFCSRSPFLRSGRSTSSAPKLFRCRRFDQGSLFSLAPRRLWRPPVLESPILSFSRSFRSRSLLNLSRRL